MRTLDDPATIRRERRADSSQKLRSAGRIANPLLGRISDPPYVYRSPTTLKQVAMADWIEEGERAPDFTLYADDGRKVKLSALRGRPVVVYFYPKDDTPGCTREACAFRDRKAEIVRLGATVLGISPDDVESHRAFRDKYGLNFPLLADPEHKVAEKYGVWRERNMYGKTVMGIQRSTFVIGAEGRVARVWRNVKVDGHHEQVLSALTELARTK
jgi:peroxiredoxin Q/BCP